MQSLYRVSTHIADDTDTNIMIPTRTSITFDPVKDSSALALIGGGSSAVWHTLRMSVWMLTANSCADDDAGWSLDSTLVSSSGDYSKDCGRHRDSSNQGCGYIVINITSSNNFNVIRSRSFPTWCVIWLLPLFTLKLFKIKMRMTCFLMDADSQLSSLYMVTWTFGWAGACRLWKQSNDLRAPMSPWW